jgi:hypothetical protein
MCECEKNREFIKSNFSEDNPYKIGKKLLVYQCKICKLEIEQDKINRIRIIIAEKQKSDDDEE